MRRRDAIFIGNQSAEAKKLRKGLHQQLTFIALWWILRLQTGSANPLLVDSVVFGKEIVIFMEFHDLSGSGRHEEPLPYKAAASVAFSVHKFNAFS